MMYFSVLPIRNSALFLFWLRKTKVPDIEKKATKAFDNFFQLLFPGGRVLGAASWAYVLILLFIFTMPRIKLHFLINIEEEIIVRADYRPDNQISECTNLEKGDWGLLAGYKKISVAHPEKSGGYIFTTKTCLFADNTL